MSCWRDRMFLGQCDTQDLVKTIAEECAKIAEQVAENFVTTNEDAEFGATKVVDAIRSRFLIRGQSCTDSPP